LSTAAFLVVNSVISVIARTNIYALYTDPGSGALLWQLLLASIVGCLFYVRRAKVWFISKTGRGQRKRLDTNQAEYAATTEQSKNNK